MTTDIIKNTDIENNTLVYSDQINDELTNLKLPMELGDKVQALIVSSDLENNPLQIPTLGSLSKNRLSIMTEEALKLIKSSEMDTLGGQLTDVVERAKGLNINELNTTSKLPIIGNIINRVMRKKENFISKFQSIDTHIKQVLEEIESTEATMLSRIETLHDMCIATQDEYLDLGVAIVAGKVQLKNMKKNITAASADKAPLMQHKANELQHTADRLERHIKDLLSLQMSALQTVPSIRLIQNNNQLQIEKFATIRELTIPIWRRQFMLAVALLEQKKAAELIDTVGSATDEMMRNYADLLKENTVSISRSTNKGIIDIDTLEYVNQKFIETSYEVNEIQKQQQESLPKHEAKIMELRNGLLTTFGKDANVSESPDILKPR